MLCVNSWEEINEERKDVEGEDECNGPFEDSSCVVGFLEIGGSESDCESDLEEDEREFDPERDTEDAMLAEVL